MVLCVAMALPVEVVHLVELPMLDTVKMEEEVGGEEGARKGQREKGPSRTVSI